MMRNSEGNRGGSGGPVEGGQSPRVGSLREELDEAILDSVLAGGLSRATTPRLFEKGAVGAAEERRGEERKKSPLTHVRKPSMDQSDVPSFAEMDPSERYGRFDEELGRGACKVVYKAFDTQEGREVAWNKVYLGQGVGGLGDDDLGKDEQDRILAEIRVLKALKHKNIMSFYKWWYNEDKAQVNFISEMFASGTLRRYRKKHKHLGDDVLKQWGWQILSGLVYLHGHKPPIVHRDLKCDNIFINGADGVVKIGDLGLATMLHGRTAPQSVIGTPEFMAPELYEEYYDDRVDVYAFGMVMLELATMEYPYSECSNAAQIYRKVTLQVRPAGLQKVTCKELADFINTCIAPLEQRPRSRGLLKHPYFASIRNSLHPSKSELFLAGGAEKSGNGAVLREEGPKSSSAALGRGAAPGSGGSAQSGGMAAAAVAASQISRSVSASPAPTGVFYEAVVSSTAGAGAGNLTGLVSQASLNSTLANEKVVPSELMRELVDSKAASMGADSEGGSGSAAGAMTPTPSQRSGRGGVGLSSPPRERLPSPLGPASVGNGNGNGASSGSVSGSGSNYVHVQAKNGVPATINDGAPTPIAAGATPGVAKRRKGISCRCAATNRCFEFAGKFREDRGKRLLSLRLKIVEPDETSRTIEFEFDMTSDTATSVASEMVGVLELSLEDAVAISEAMEAEISQLLSSLEGQASSDLAQAVGEFQHELSSALQHASSVDTGFGGNSSVSLSGGNSLESPHSRLQAMQLRGLSGKESMGSLQSFDSQRSLASNHSHHSEGHGSGNHSGMSTPSGASRSANRSPLYHSNHNGSTEDVHTLASNANSANIASNANTSTHLIRQNSSDVLSKLHPNVENSLKAQTPPGGSSRSSFEMRLSPRDGESSRDGSGLGNRSLKKLYESLQQVSDSRESPGATAKPPLPPSASSKPTGASLSAQTSLQSVNSGLSDIVMKEAGMMTSTGTSSGPGSVSSDKGECSDDKPISKEEKLQQAMNALKVVESRSLELLGGGCSKKGVPMKSEKKRTEEISLEPFPGTVTASSSHDSIDVLPGAGNNHDTSGSSAAGHVAQR